MGWLLSTLALALVGLALAADDPAKASGPPSSTSTVSERQVKAAFLYNFARFTTWPDNAMGEADAPFVFAVLGDDALARDLTSATANRSLEGHPIRVRLVHTPEDIEGAMVIYAGPHDAMRWAPVFASLRDRPVLTVGTDEHFAQKEGIIGFYIEEDHVHFAINTGAAERSGLAISSRLLALARIVEDGKP